MKLSELFRTPFKLKGGSTLNLRGFSKRVVDKEVEGGGGESTIFDTIIPQTIKPHNSKVIRGASGSEPFDISEIEDVEEVSEIYFLYKKSDIDQLNNSTKITCRFNKYSSSISCDLITKSDTDYGILHQDIIIDGEEYVAVWHEMI